jgi:hypothetical protein
MTGYNFAHIISHVNTEFLDYFMGGCQPWKHFQDSLVPRLILIKWPLVRLAQTCKLCTDHPRSNCFESLTGSLFYHLLSEYANRPSVLLFRNKWCLFHVLFLDCCQTCPISHVMHRNAIAVYMDFSHLLHERTYGLTMTSLTSTCPKRWHHSTGMRSNALETSYTPPKPFAKSRRYPSMPMSCRSQFSHSQMPSRTKGCLWSMLGAA